MKVLYILGAYKPLASANGLCSDNVIQALANEGHEVTVLCNQCGKSPRFAVEPNGVKVYRIKQKLFLQLQEWASVHQDKAVLSAVASSLANVVNKMQLFLMSGFWPFVAPIYTYCFYRKAVELHQRFQYDVVIGVYTPFDCLLAAHMLKKKFPKLFFVPYYLDALAGGWGPHSWSNEKISQRTQKWEYKIDGNADLIISMESARHYHDTSWNYPVADFNRQYLDVPMMLPVEPATVDHDASKRKFALFAGAISYPRRNPIPLLEVFQRVCNQLDMDLIFVGTCNNRAVFEPYIAATNGRIKLLGQVSHDEVMNLEKNADYLVNLGSSNPYTIPCKIFEYMRFNKPILSTYAIDNEPSIEYLEKYGCVFFLDERKPADLVADQLIAAMTHGDFVNQGIDCESVFYVNTPRAFVKLLSDSMVKGHI